MKTGISSRLREFGLRYGVPRSVILDFCLLAGLFAVLNFWLAPDYLGFPRLNPSPYLLIPVIIGTRYGFQSGLYSGVIVSGMLYGGMRLNHLVLDSHNFREIYRLCAPPVVGAISGEMLTYYRRAHSRELQEARSLRRMITLMRSEIRMLRHDADENIRSGLTAQVLRVNLEEDLRALMQVRYSELPTALLAILRNHAQVREAAIYSVDAKGGGLTRVRLLGSNRSLPERLALADFPMLAQAVDVGRITSLVVSAKVETVISRPHLIAAPLRGDDEKTSHLLVVADVPLIAFNARTVRLVALICKWAEECFQAASDSGETFRIVAGGLNRRIYTAGPFRAFVEACLRLGLRQNVAWRLCEVTYAPADSAMRDKFEETVMRSLGADDVAYADGEATARILVLLPWSNTNATMRFERRLRGKLDRDMPGEQVFVRMIRSPGANELDKLLGPAVGKKRA